jgi:hypothetical protein
MLLCLALEVLPLSSRSSLSVPNAIKRWRWAATFRWDLEGLKSSTRNRMV